MPNKFNRERGKIGQTWGRGRGGIKSESARRERMESARGRMHLTSGRTRMHTQQSWFLFFSVRSQLVWCEKDGLPIWLC